MWMIPSDNLDIRTQCCTARTFSSQQLYPEHHKEGAQLCLREWPLDSNIYTKVKNDSNKEYLLEEHNPQPKHSTLFLHHNPLSLEGKDTGAVGEEVVVAGDVLGVTALVQQLQVARVDGEGLVGVGTEQVTVGDVVGPRGAGVGLAGESVLLGSSLGGPVAAEAGGGEAAEVTAGGANGFDNHEVLGVAGAAGEGVNLDSLEQVVLAVGHDDGAGGTEVAGEVADRHAGAVDLAVVAGEEQVHVLGVTDHGLVDGAGVRAGDLSGEEGLSSTPAVDVGGVGAGAVGEGSGAPLVGKNPDVLRSEVEEGWGNSVEALGVLASRGEVRPVVDEAEVHGAVVAIVLGDGTVDELLAVELNGGEVLEGGPSALGLSKSISRAPGVLGGQGAGGLAGGGRGQDDRSDAGEVHGDEEANVEAVRMNVDCW